MSGEKHIPYGESVGVLVGRGAEQNLLRAAVAFVESQKAPILGEFLVIEENELRKRKLLCRVDDVTYGDFHTTQDERERTLVEKYVRDVSGHKRALSEDEKKALFFQHYVLRVLGEFRQDVPNGSFRIATDYRVLPSLTALLRYPTEEELKILTKAGLTVEDKDLSAIGHLAFGEYEYEKIPIYFDVSKFAARRTAIFARTGYGKSNLAKFVATLAGISSPNSGMIILDLDGEYAFTIRDKDGQVKSYGLTDIPHLENRLTIFTNRTVQTQNSKITIKPFMNFKVMSPYDIKRLIPIEGDEESATVSGFATTLDAAKVEWADLLDFVENDPLNWRQRNQKVETLTEAALKAKKIKENQRNLLFRIVDRLLPLHNPKGGDFFEDVQKELKQRKIVILDLSLFPIPYANQIASVVLQRIFTYNQYHITSQDMVSVIAVFEEAQNVLNKKAVEAGESIFVRWAKEGRKFGLGLIYITQQPGAIAEEIVSQTDNFFVMHLLGKNDVDALIRANRHYDGVIAHFLVSETVVGNAYVYSAPYQPYVFPAHIWEFKPEIFTKLFGDSKQSQSPRPQRLF
jgi:hypothetical protein